MRNFIPERVPLHHMIIVAITAVVCGKEMVESPQGCSFKNNGCTYNIELQHTKGSSECGGIVQKVLLDRAQNDYSAKINDIEKNFSFLRDAHEQRLKELESTVRELLDFDETSSNSKQTANESTDKLFNPATLDKFSVYNGDLMKKLETEFSKLRKEIKEKSSQLIDTRMKLNETSVMMHEAQLRHFQTSQSLVKTENQITMLKRERAVLKNQVKDKTYRLRIMGQKATDCEQKSISQQDKLIKLFRSEATLTEDLMTVQMKFNETKKEHEKVRVKHRELKKRHEHLRTVMKIREKELINCYSAKTSTFCDFEDPNICGFTDIKDTSDFFDWTRGHGRTPSAKTGPLRDHTCKGPHGHYMYIEASAKGRGNNAILYSPLYRGLNEQCVEFFYHMNGRHIGTLNVYARTRGQVLESAWRAYGNQGDVWSNARLAIPKELAMAGYQIAFEGVTETGYQGDMAIDDVSVTDGPCPLDVKFTRIKVPTNSTSIIKKGRSFARKIRRRLKKRT